MHCTEKLNRNYLRFKGIIYHHFCTCMYICVVLVQTMLICHRSYIEGFCILYFAGNEDINDLVYTWYCDASSRNIEVTGPLIQEKTLQFANELNINSFKASNGWLQSFVTRHNLVFKKMSGERGDINNRTVEDYRRKIPDICEGYPDCDIFNMDETGLFFKDGKNKT